MALTSPDSSRRSRPYCQSVSCWVNRVSPAASAAVTRDLSTSRLTTSRISPAGDSVVAADRLGGCQPAAAGKHGKPVEQDAFVVEQQVVAPVHHRPQRLLAGQGGSGPSGEEPEPILEALRHRGHCQCAESGGRELDRQGQAIESATDVLDNHAGAIVCGESWSHRSGALDEQLDGGRRGQTAHRHQDFTGTPSGSRLVVINRSAGSDPIRVSARGPPAR